MADIALKAGKRNRTLLERIVGGPSFGNIAMVRRRTMTIHITDCIGRYSRIFNRQFESLLHGFFLGLRNVFAIGIRTETDQFRINLRTTSLSVFIFFENQGTSTFANHETVAVLVVGSRRKFRMIVLGACRKQSVEHGRFGRIEFVGTACNHHILLAVLDEFVGLTDSEASAGARRIRRDQATRKAKNHADIHGTSLRHGADVCRRGNLGAVVGLEHREELEQRVDTTHRGAESDTHATGLHQSGLVR